MTTPARQTRRSVREASVAQSQKSILEFYKVRAIFVSLNLQPVRGIRSSKRLKLDPGTRVGDLKDLATDNRDSPSARTSGAASLLVKAIRNSSTFPLPSSYEDLHELFQHCERHLGQILYVYAKAYDVHAEKCEVVIRLNTTDDLPDCLDRAKMKDVAYGRKQRLEAWRLTCRSQVFRHRLVDVVKKAHTDFLNGRGEQADVEAIKRFHPDFKLENLPPVPMIELPKRSFSGLRLDTEKKAPGPSLLERAGFTRELYFKRIRAKEEERKRIAMLHDEAGERRKRGIERLQADVLRILTTYYTYAKRSSLEWTHVVDRVVLSTRNMSRGSVEKLLELLIDVAPSHVVSVEVRHTRYLKMANNNHEDIDRLLLEELLLTIS